MTVFDTHKTLMNCPHKTLEKPTLEPSTPSGTSEAVPSSPPPSDKEPDSLGSDYVSVSGSDRRRSRRLASKLNMADRGCSGSFISYNRRRRKTVSRESDGGLDSESEGVRGKKSRVSGGIRENEGLGIEEPEIKGIGDIGFLQNSAYRENDMNLGASGEGEEGGGEKSDVRELGEIGSGGDCALETSDAIVAVDDAKVKGELVLDLNLPASEVAEEGGSELGFLENTQLQARN
ncbi:hypothetical protein L1049_019141 [Liquidambar formosana]|uniref:Uncharacterized protein n=1 Tax=Liquidambar formosana TaxID=63359 RepID=A0AAP0WMQ5_LIQFO